MEIKSIDKDTFMELYDRYAEKVYQIALYYSGNEDVAEDITQEVFLKLYMDRDSLYMDYIGAWMKVTARNYALNYNRDYTDKTNIIEGVKPKEGPIDNSCEDKFFRKLILKERAEFVKRMLDEMYMKKPRWHKALILIFIEGKSYPEAAESMNMSIGAFNVMLHRIRKWMKKRYQEQFDHLDSI